MSQVSEILARKSGPIHTIEVSARVFDAIQKMVNKNVGALLVTEGGEVRGIFTERDYLRRIALEDRTSKTTGIGEVMTSQVVCVDSDRSIEDCMAIMTQKRIRHLPVMEGGKLVGIVSIGDLVKHVSAQSEIGIRYLTDYITGKYPA